MAHVTALRRAFAVLLTALLLLLLTGCGATATVAVRVGADGAGTLDVRVDVDRAALDVIGGLAQLRTADVTAAGWVVHGPAPTPGGGAQVDASHPFADISQLQALLASVAATRLHGQQIDVVTLDLTTSVHDGTTVRTLRGRIDLTCGLACFGDARLRHDYGSAVGVDPDRVAGPGGVAVARRDLHLEVSVALPGVVRTDDATGRDGSELVWAVPIGASAPVDAITVTRPPPSRSTATGPVLAAGAGVLIIVAVLVGLLVTWRRHRRPVPAHRS